MTEQTRKEIKVLAEEYFSKKRIAISTRYPTLQPVVLFIRRIVNNIFIYTNLSFTTKFNNKYYFNNKVYKSSSLLRRRLGSSNPALQEGKIKNLKVAIKKLDGVVIGPGQSFSFWRLLGSTTAKKGYVEGMLLSQGRVVEGLGGGLCQLSNLLHWVFLHSPLEITERYHHSFDPFPDSARTIPFGVGATIFHNRIDLRVKNTTNTSFQIYLEIDEKNISCALYSVDKLEEKVHVYATDEYFISAKGVVFRYNQIWKRTKKRGEVQEDKRIMTNFAPVMYDLPKHRITNGTW